MQCERIAGCRNLNYWEALKKLGLYSLQRRRERYQIIYIWSILEGKVPNITSEDGLPLIVPNALDSRRGRCVRLPPVKRTKYSKFRYNSLSFHGARLFNAMPNALRSLTQISKDDFKLQLDNVLKCIADEPQILHYTSFRRAPTNSIVDMKSIASCSKSTMSCGC